MLQVQRNQCGENPASAARAQAAEGHQQGQGIKGLHMLVSRKRNGVAIQFVFTLDFSW